MFDFRRSQTLIVEATDDRNNMFLKGKSRDGRHGQQNERYGCSGGTAVLYRIFLARVANLNSE